MADVLAPVPIVELAAGCVIRFEAVSPTTGAAVAGVTIANGVIYGKYLDAGGGVAGDIAPALDFAGTLEYLPVADEQITAAAEAAAAAVSSPPPSSGG